MNIEPTPYLQRLDSLLTETAKRFPRRIALIETHGADCTYEGLYHLARRLAQRLQENGVKPQDRVGICMQKSIGSVAAIFAILMSGGAYVPVDPASPVGRTASILAKCQVCALIVDRDLVEPLSIALQQYDWKGGLLVHSPDGFESVKSPETIGMAHERTVPHDSIAYILHTSGSTGEPKGVMLSHRNAVSFINWCTELIHPSEKDRFASHAPFWFDLSVLDIFLAVKHGAGVVLLNSNDPRQLTREISEQEITIWYSTPSVLQTMTGFGKMDRHSFTKLHTILFAGEVFPIRHLRVLKNLIPHARYINLYGPTETNVCTYYEIPDQIKPEQEKPFPIGTPCSHMECRVVDNQGIPVPPGHEGELLVHGEGVMVGYWNRPEETRRVFFCEESGKEWYRTGDLVCEDETGNLHFIGRNDRMVKRRGYRVELGEIEHCLSRNEQIERVAVTAVSDETEVRIIAFYTLGKHGRLSHLEIRKFVAENLPMYMMPDDFVALSEIPQTSTLKTDYEKLKELT